MGDRGFESVSLQRRVSRLRHPRVLGTETLLISSPPLRAPTCYDLTGSAQTSCGGRVDELLKGGVILPIPVVFHRWR
jgi:hypothetical protein